jgi:hypothetical protein
MQEHPIYIVSCANGQMTRLTQKAPVTARKDIYVFHHWYTPTPQADLMKASRVLKPWYVSGDMYAMDAAQLYATIVDKIPSLKASPIISWPAMEDQKTDWTPYIKAGIWGVCAFASIPLAIIVAIHLGAISGVAAGGVFALILNAIK